MYPNNTGLANLVKEFGDNALIHITSLFFSSPLASMLIYLSGVAMLLVSAVSLHKKSFHPFIFTFWAGWICCLPVQGKPILYTVINTITTILSTEMSKMTHSLFATGKSMPPGFVYNAIYKAAMSKIDDPNLDQDISFLLDNCIPDVENKDHNPLSAADLFSYKVDTSMAGSESFSFNFDPRYLQVREFDIAGGGRINCFFLLEDVIRKVRNHVRSNNPTVMPPNLYVGANNGEPLGVGTPVTNWDKTGSPMAYRVEKMAINLAQANAIQAHALNQYFGTDLSTSGKNMSNQGLLPLIAATKNMTGTAYINPMRIKLSTMGYAQAITRALNVDGFNDNANMLMEMNEKLRNLPYIVAFVQTLLKIVFPVICFSIFLGTWRFIRLWTAAWTITLLTPWFFYLSRMFSNTILLHVNKVSNMAPALPIDPSFLEHGVDFSVATQMLEDTSRALNVFLQCELGIWGSLSLIIPTAAFLAGRKQSGGGILGKVKSLIETAVLVKTGGIVAAGAGQIGQKVVSKLQKTPTTANVPSSGGSNFKDYFKGKKAILPFLFLFSLNLYGGSDIVDTATIVKDAANIIKNLGFNCANPSKLPENIALFKKELLNTLAGMARVTAEQTLQLALKKDFPTICHVLTQPQIDAYVEGAEVTKKSHTLINLGKKVKKNITATQPKPSYYWPKYFIEVMEKGNDPHAKFAKANSLYMADRKIAAGLRKFVDMNGAITLTSYVMGGSVLAEKIIPNFRVGEQNWSSLMNSTALTPFEKMRIRADQKTAMASYDVNIWPVSLSETLATHFSVCGPELVQKRLPPGGYAWPFKGVPMTCPVAMSSDAYAYWDTGMLDYLDPEAISAMMAASNPLTCGMSAGMEFLSNESSTDGKSLGDKEQSQSAMSQLTDNLKRGLQVCSFPILGHAQAIATKALDATSSQKWKQVKCTLWGSLAPRMSTSMYKSDYSFANTALKFKLLAHEMFGVPRGREERWSLAYPWEGKGSTAGTAEGLEKIKEKLEGIFEKLKEKGIDLGGNISKSRSEGLYPAGHPALVNASYTAKFFKDRSTQFLKEGAYLVSLMGASVAAGTVVDEALKKEAIKTQQEQLSAYQQALTKAEEETALVGKEPIYQSKTYCHKSQIRGLIQGTESFTIPISISVGASYSGTNFPFILNSQSDCFSTPRYSNCLKYVRGVCREPNKVVLISFEKQEIIGYKDVQNPTIKHFKTECSSLPVFVHRSKHTYGLHKFETDDEFIYRYECHDVDKGNTIVDTKDYIERPNTIEQATGNSQTANFVKAAAIAAPWVTAEVMRAKYGEMLGYNPIGGDRRIYTIWEKIECTIPAKRVEIEVGGVNVSNLYRDQFNNPSCKEAIKYEVHKYIQLKLLRKICDAFGSKEGEPWK